MSAGVLGSVRTEPGSRRAACAGARASKQAELCRRRPARRGPPPRGARRL